MTCTSCGSDNPEEARFCAYCGHSFVVAAGEPPAPEASLPAQGSAPIALDYSTVSLPVDQAGGWQRAVLGLAALILLFIGVASALSFAGGVFFILPGAGFGYAAVRPPRRTLRRILVTAACLALLLVAAAIVTVLFWILLHYDFD